MTFPKFLLPALAAAMLSALAPAPAAAQSAFDGLWSVLIITEQGSCDRGYRYPLRIERGRVSHADANSSNFDIQGVVSGGGTLKVTVTRGNQSASGIGRLSRTYGTGKWKTIGGECSGIWQAEKRS